MCDHCSCRSFAPIAELTAEHERILCLGWELAESARTGDPRHPASREALVALLDAHGTKEETGLYPALLSTGGATTETVAALEQDHRDLHATLAAGRFDRRAFYALAAHIEEEEMELFSAAMLRFDEDDWAATNSAHCAVEPVAPLAAAG